jgi:hypothetical protein
MPPLASGMAMAELEVPKSMAQYMLWVGNGTVPGARFYGRTTRTPAA